MLRRTGIDMGKELMQAGNLSITTASQRGGRVGTWDYIASITEYRLFCFFLWRTQSGLVHARSQMLVWGGNVYIDERTIDVHVYSPSA